MSYRLFDNHEGDKKSILRNVWLGLDCLNLFGINNVNSYYWITDVTGQQYAVPNYLTGQPNQWSHYHRVLILPCITDW